jgi:DNA-binding NarL/FixJ family response regulator
MEPSNRIRILLLAADRLLRASVARLLAMEADFEVVGESGEGEDALRLLKDSAVDLVVLDFDLGLDEANRFISAARAAGYEGRLLVVSGSLDSSRAAMAFHWGASGIFLKSDAPERLVQAIEIVQTGAIWIDRSTVELLARECARGTSRGPKSKAPSLDDREQKVLSGILGGLTNRGIGASIGVSETSVKNTLQRLFAKAGVRTRGQLVRLAMEGSLGREYGKSPRRLSTLSSA